MGHFPRQPIVSKSSGAKMSGDGALETPEVQVVNSGRFLVLTRILSLQAEGVARLVECLPRLHRAQGSSPRRLLTGLGDACP